MRTCKHTRTWRSISRTAFGVAALVIATVVALAAFEGLVATNSTEHAYGWHCSMTASPTSVASGQSVTLSWTSDEDVSYVTIDQINNTHYGRNGTLVVNPTQTTTYVARTHVDWSPDTMSCGVTVYVDEPQWPACPFTASNNTQVLEFTDRYKVRSNGTETESHTRVYPLTLAAGTYKVQSASWDGFTGRQNETQPREQWYLDIRSSTSSLAHSRTTSDLADYVASAFKVETLDEMLQVNGAVSGVEAVHAAYPDTSSSNSVYPLCVSFTAVSQSGPSCALSVSASHLTSAGSVMLSWTSSGATSGSINQGVGSVGTNGTTTVSVDRTTTYTGTFTGTNGSTVQCSATVSVGGGGACVNCGDSGKTKSSVTKRTEHTEDATPNVVLSRVISNMGITLSQVPYTGFDAGPVATVLFWVFVLAVSAAIAYVFTRFNPLLALKQALYTWSANGAAMSVSPMHTAVPETPVRTWPTVSVSAPYQAYALTNAQRDGVGVVEDRAHADNILLSPEASRMIMEALQQGTQSVDQFLASLFGYVKSTYPQEDGWILLSKERAQASLGHVGTGVVNVRSVQQTVTDTLVATSQRSTPPHVSVRDTNRTAAAPSNVPQQQVRMEQVRPEAHDRMPVEATRGVSQNTESAGVMAAAVNTFVQYVTSGEQQKAFELLRTVSSKGVSTERFVGHVVTMLDAVYKNRLEGNHDPDQQLAATTATWSNADFETVIGTLVECLDYTYSSSRVGIKVALTKVFDTLSKATV